MIIIDLKKLLIYNLFQNHLISWENRGYGNPAFLLSCTLSLSLSPFAWLSAGVNVRCTQKKISTPNRECGLCGCGCGVRGGEHIDGLMYRIVVSLWWFRFGRADKCDDSPRVHTIDHTVRGARVRVPDCPSCLWWRGNIGSARGKGCVFRCCNREQQLVSVYGGVRQLEKHYLD